MTSCHDRGRRRFPQCAPLGKEQLFIDFDRAGAHRLTGVLAGNMCNCTTRKARPLGFPKRQRLANRLGESGGGPPGAPPAPKTPPPPPPPTPPPRPHPP